jgi:aldose 1-epimerase
MTDHALETVHLRDETAGLEAAFVPGAGMLCCSLRHHGEELLAQNAGVGAYAQRGKTMGIPLLYPWANRLAGFDYTAGGRTVQVPHDETLVHTDANGLPIHGVIGGRMAWELTGAVESSACSLSASFSWSEQQPELFEVFPFRHELRYEVLLQEGRLEIALTVDACGEDAVPLAFGFHPYLSPGGEREGWQVELPAMRALTLDLQQIPVASGQVLAPQRFELAGREPDDGFDDISEPARFCVTGVSRRLDLAFLQGYPCAQLFAPASGQFICFEPMTAPANALRSGDGLRLVAPRKSFVAGFALVVSDVR